MSTPTSASGTNTESTIPSRVQELIDLFDSDIDHFRSTEFKETSLRIDFVDPLLEALGWNPRHRKLAPYSEREVIQEDSISIEGHQKAPDYALQLAGSRKFFLEAKRPHVNVGEGRSAAYQIRRYCWSAGLPFGLLTDFEEYAVYDCRTPPDSHDKADVARIRYFTYKELQRNWEWLSNNFGRESVANGSLDELAATEAAPRGTRPIDAAFLEEIRTWRKELAADIAWRNEDLDVIDLNRVVQNTIDRLIFLRIAEARGLEAYNNLWTATQHSQHVYDTLKKVFRRADDRYNSGLFHFESRKDAIADPDRLSLSIDVGNGVLRRTLSRMYFPHPYEFSVMPADILGRIYEQFLGEVIELRSKRTVDLSLKPELRRSGGVYYTPQPIVDYIVTETIGPLIKGKTPREVANLRIVDPACGSGSFLIAVFQQLIDWHREYYSSRPRLATQFLETASDGQVRLRTPERKRILQNNIFGVDIDPQAVEVTKLSLLLKVIEGQNQLELEVGRILPDLGHNILCGNSLISSDFQPPEDVGRVDQVMQYSPFNWSEKFPETMGRGGFDAVVGNPPYLNVDAVWGRHDPRLSYLSKVYDDIYTDKTDILFYFLQKAVEISRGEVGYIVSRSFLEAAKARKLRAWLGNHARVRHVLDMRHAIVFPKVGINTAIVRLTHSRVVRSSHFSRFEARALPPGYNASTLRSTDLVSTVTVPTNKLGADSWLFGTADVESVIAKIDGAGEQVGDVLWVGKGMEAGRNKAFYYDSAPERLEELRQDGLLYTRARNSDIDQYSITDSNIHLLYLEDVSSFNDLPDDIRRHLRRFEDELRDRAAFRRGNCDWWRYTWPLHKERVKTPRLICPYRASINRFGVDLDCFWLGLTDTTVLYESGQDENILYFAGILNTDILSARFRLIGKLLGGRVIEYYENTVRRLPVPRISSSDSRHREVVDCVEGIMHNLALSKWTLINAEKWELDQEIAVLKQRIEMVAQDLYGITEEEVAAMIELLSD